MKNAKVHFCSILLMILGRKKGKKGAFFLLQSFGQSDTTKKTQLSQQRKKKRENPKTLNFQMLLIDKVFCQFLKKKDRENLGAESENPAFEIYLIFPFFFLVKN